jgi:hypothetical protein
MKLPDAYLQRKLSPDTLPDWNGDGQRMFVWALRELDLVFDLEFMGRNTPEAIEEFERYYMEGEARALDAAEHGDIEPLRSLAMSLFKEKFGEAFATRSAPFLNLPKRGSQQMD